MLLPDIRLCFLTAVLTLVGRRSMIERLEAVDLINEDERPDMREEEAF